MKRLLPILAFLCVLLPGAALGHSDGAFWESIVDPYVLDIGYDPPAAVAGDSMRFDFALWDTARENIIPFSSVWVRVKHENETILATGVHRQSLGPTTLLYRFEQAGKYTLEVSFRDDKDDEVVKESFPFEIAPSGDRSTYGLFALLVLIGLVAGVLISYALLKRS